MPPQYIGIVANADDEVDRTARNANCNTLKRSASKRFKQQVGGCVCERRTFAFGSTFISRRLKTYIFG